MATCYRALASPRRAVYTWQFQLYLETYRAQDATCGATASEVPLRELSKVLTLLSTNLFATSARNAAESLSTKKSAAGIGTTVLTLKCMLAISADPAMLESPSHLAHLSKRPLGLVRLFTTRIQFSSTPQDGPNTSSNHYKRYGDE